MLSDLAEAWHTDSNKNPAKVLLKVATEFTPPPRHAALLAQVMRQYVPFLKCYYPYIQGMSVCLSCVCAPVLCLCACPVPVCLCL